MGLFLRMLDVVEFFGVHCLDSCCFSFLRDGKWLCLLDEEWRLGVTIFDRADSVWFFSEALAFFDGVWSDVGDVVSESDGVELSEFVDESSSEESSVVAS